MLKYIKKELVITGNRGFIGMNFMEYAIKKKRFLNKYDVVTLIDAGRLKDDDGNDWMMRDNFEFYKKLKKMKFKLKTIDYISINKTEILKKRFTSLGTKYDVLNFASESHVDDSIDDPFYIYNENSSLVPSLVNVLGMDNINNFWHIRTDEEYGQLESKDDEAFEVDAITAPRNPYSASKASQTLFLHSLKETFGMSVSFFVLANQYGKYQHDSKMIPKTIKRLLSGESALIYGDGSQYREWTFVEDTIEHIYKSISKNKNNTLTTHISNPKGLTTNINLVKDINTILDVPENIEFIDDRLGHDFCYKLKSCVKCKTSLTDGLTKTIEFYKEHYNV